MREKLALALGSVLADAYVLLVRTHGFHWNVRGPQFPGLHALFETHYQELFPAIDEMAERIRALGYFAQCTMGDLTERASLDVGATADDADGKVRRLLQDNEAVGRACREVAELCDEVGDTATEDLMNARMTAHDKNAWMLRACLAD